MTDRETLIEEAAEAFGGLTSPTYGAAPEWERAEVYEGVKRVLDVFEKAYTPTGDQREALALTDFEWRAFQEMPQQSYFSARTWFDGVLASHIACLMRSEVPEPSDIAHMIERSSLGTPEAQALRSTVSEEKAAALVAEAQRRSVPQGEPSDAQAEALKVLEEVEPLAAVFGNLTAFGRAVIALRHLVDERAALRAAWGER